MLEVALIGDVYGEESACNGHYYGNYKCVPRHIECISYVLECEVRNYNVEYVEHCIAADVTECDTYYEGHDRHTQTAKEIDGSYIALCCAHGLNDIELFFSLEVVVCLREEPDDR